jgi:hypothetical protein
MLKAYKYRIYPNSEQRTQIAKTFGCCRFVYNQTLGQGLPELTPVEIVGYEVDEAGSPLTLDNG